MEGIELFQVTPGPGIPCRGQLLVTVSVLAFKLRGEMFLFVLLHSSEDTLSTLQDIVTITMIVAVSTTLINEVTGYFEHVFHSCLLDSIDVINVAHMLFLEA